MKKAVVTVLGQDKVGITAKICGVLAETNINILDISQTIVGGYFNMVMVVDITEAKDTFDETAEKLYAFYRDICLLNFGGVLSKMEEPFSEKRRTIRMKKAVVTVLGQDKVGITAKICGVLAETNINILDISQTIVGGYFNMVMVVDITEAKDTFDETAEKLYAVGEELGMKIKIQHTEIFDAMHRI